MAWLPNLLTCVRILLTPIIIYTIITGQCRLALPLSMVAGFTDAADGYLARRFSWTSRMGAYLDPVADKLLLTSLFICFGVIDLVPDWLIWLVVARDVLILAMVAAGLLLTAIREFPPTTWGKLSTVVQIGAALVFLAGCAGIQTGKVLIPVAVPAVAAATGWSGLHYVWRAFVLVRSAKQKV